MAESQCRFCGKRYANAGIARHVAACKARSGLEGQTAMFSRLSVVDPHDADYRLDLLARPRTTLSDLDAFLREIWLECCGHMSMFRIGEVSFTSSPDAFYGERNTDVALANLPNAADIHYTYDMGSPTDLRIRILSPVEHADYGPGIVLAARNDPPPVVCSCGAEAIAIDRYAGWDGGVPLCEACMQADDVDTEGLAPLTNSPRTGVCGYYGPGSDPDGEYETRTKAEALIEDLPSRRDQRTIDGGSAEERSAVVARYVARLSGPAKASTTKEAARFIDRNIERFVPALREIVVEALEKDWKEPRRPGAPHIYALYLVGQLPDASLFSALEDTLREGSRFAERFGDAFDFIEACTSLFASLCRHDPGLLVRAAEDDAFIVSGRGCAIRALATLYLTGRLERPKVVRYLERVADSVVASGDAFIADSLAEAICAIYPDELIRVVQRLEREGLLERSGTDYLDRIRRQLEQSRELHLMQMQESGDYYLLDDPVFEIEVVLAEDSSSRMHEAYVESADDPARRPVAQPSPSGFGMRSDGGLVRIGGKVGRNERCPCGSGKKYKYCCGR
ncbi:MAG: DUF1186 domain-containing protein [Spirochaetota bacterium]